MPASSTESSASLVLTWTDPRPRLAWFGLCLLLALGCLEVALRGHAWQALAALPAICLLAWCGLPAAATRQGLELHPKGLFWRPTPDADWMELAAVSATLLPALVVLQWRPAGRRCCRYLWLWRGDAGDAGFRQLRRWLLCTGRISAGGEGRHRGYASHLSPASAQCDPARADSRAAGKAATGSRQEPGRR